MLDKFDAVLANVSKHAEGSEWILVYDELHLKDKEQVQLVFINLGSSILYFTIHTSLSSLFLIFVD